MSRGLTKGVLVVAGAILCAAIIAAAVLGKAGATQQHHSNLATESQNQEVAPGKFTGDFVDIDDRAAMEKWARHMCQGLKLDQVAKTLGTDATVPAVAQALMGRQAEDPNITKAIVKICEDELTAANPSNGD